MRFEKTKEERAVALYSRQRSWSCTHGLISISKAKIYPPHRKVHRKSPRLLLRALKMRTEQNSANAETFCTACAQCAQLAAAPPAAPQCEQRFAQSGRTG